MRAVGLDDPLSRTIASGIVAESSSETFLAIQPVHARLGLTSIPSRTSIAISHR